MDNNSALVRKTLNNTVKQENDGVTTGEKDRYPPVAISREHIWQQSWARPFDWALRRDIITQLYIIDDLSLKEVERIMREEFQFHATPKMYKDHFRKWGFRKNLSSQFIEDILRRTRQTSATEDKEPIERKSETFDRDLGRRINRYLRTTYLTEHPLWRFGSLRQPIELPHNTRYAEQSTAMTSLPNDSEAYINPWGLSHQATTNQTLNWVTILGMALSSLRQGRVAMGFALLNHCFEKLAGMLEPSIWLIFTTFYAISSLSKSDPILGNMFLRYLENLMSTRKHAFHDLLAVLKQCGADGVSSVFSTVIGDYLIDTLLREFPEKASATRVMLDLVVQGNDLPFQVYSMPAPQATVQKARDIIANKNGAIPIKSLDIVNGHEKHTFVLSLPESPTRYYDIVNEANIRCSLPSPPLTDPGSDDIHEESCDFSLTRNETVIEQILRESPVEMYSDELSVTAQLADLAICFDATADVSEVEEVTEAYRGLKGLFENLSLHSEHTVKPEMVEHRPFSPAIPDRPKTQIPARPSKSPSGVRESKAAAKQKTAVPARPVGRKIAVLQAGFMSDLNKRLQLRPRAPKKDEPKEEEVKEKGKEKAPFPNARKSRARGSQRRAPTKSSSPSTVPIPTERQQTDYVHHLHQDKHLSDVEVDIGHFLRLLPNEIRYDLRLEKVLGNCCWTCIPPDTNTSYPVPLTIANIPVVVPIKTYYPLNAGLMPPDPHPHHISSVKELCDDTVEQILDTFEEATGFYLLVNGMLQIIVPDEFDIYSAVNHYPGRFGGLQVSFIAQTQISTAGEASKRRKTSSTEWGHISAQTQNTMESSTSATPSGSGFGNLMSNSPRPIADQGLSIGSSVRAQVNNGKSKNRSQAKLGLMTEAQNRFYLTLPTHLVTEALIDSKLDWEWPQSGLEEVRLVAGNNNAELGKVARTFDTDARVFPDGFEHDVSLVDVSDLPTTMTGGMKPCVPLEWFSDQEWASLQFNTRSVFLLDDKDRTVKSIGIRLHQFQVGPNSPSYLGREANQQQTVGQGIFVHRQKSKRWSVRELLRRGKNRQDTESELAECKRLVARSILYRVAHDYEAPGGQSGTPVCLLDESDPGMHKGKVVGFTSYMQMVQDVQHYHVEGDQLTKMLQDGRVAFYGAFKVPREMREEHVIV
ncbi:uncharacterized protein PG986_004459 [Apiospora aurea]|uniref:Clr5 domain-containing protein n=1 Tax=Apiospora aurea TaxID=335848 RepID=A0ABR1QNE1_9PEZI